MSYTRRVAADLRALDSGTTLEARAPHDGGVDPEPGLTAQPERLAVRVIPCSRRNEAAGERAGRLIVRVTAAPVDGRANDAMREVVAAHLGVRVPAVTIIQGERSRDKLLEIRR